MISNIITALIITFIVIINTHFQFYIRIQAHKYICASIVTNAFHVNQRTPVAQLYNDTSVLENFQYVTLSLDNF